MPTFEWRRYKTRHFGESWQPIVEIEFRTVARNLTMSDDMRNQLDDLAAGFRRRGETK